MALIGAWLTDVPRSAWTALLTALVTGLFLAAAKRRQEKDAEGWIRLTPTWGVLVLTILSIPMILLFLLCLVLVIGAALQDPADTFTGQMARASGITLLLAPPLAVMLGWSALWTFLCRQRFNADGFEQRFLGRRQFVSWAEVAAVKRHWLLGPRMRTRSGPAFQLSEVYRGFAQLVDQATGAGVKIEL